MPLYIAIQGLMGLRPSEPGFKKYKLRPQLGDLADLDLTAFTVLGPLSLRASGKPGDRELVLQLPAGGQGDLIVPEGETVDLAASTGSAPTGTRRYKLPSGATVTLHLKHV